jgi:hypothetical protein
MGIVDENIALKNDYYEQLTPLRNRAQRFESFYRGGQYSRKEKRILKQSGLIPLVINIVRPLLLQRRAILTSSKPTWKVVPLQGGNKVVADAAQQFLVGKWNADYVDTQLNRVLKDTLIVGWGCLFVDKASFLDNSTFDINIKHLSWKYVLPDPKSQEFDWSDAENILIRKFVSLSRAQVLYGLTKEEAESAVSDEASYNSGTTEATRQVEVLDRFSKYSVVMYNVSPVEGEHLRDLPTVFYTDKLETKTSQENRRLATEMEKLKVDGKIELKKMRDLNIYRAITVGQFPAYHGVMNIRDYPVIPFINEYGTTFEETQGDVEFLEGIQKAENKTYLLTLHNAMLTGNFRVLGPKNAVKNKTQFQRTSTLPGAYLEYEPDPTLPNGGKPEIIQPGTISSAFFTLSGDLMEKAKFETSVYSPMLGDPKGTPETFSTSASLQDFGTQPIRELARRVDIMIAKAGEVALQFIQNYTDKNELLEYVDMSSGELTSPMMKNEITDSASPTGDNQQAPQANQDQNKIILNEVVIKEGVIHEIKNNTRLGKYAVKVLTQPNLGSDRLIKAAFMQQMIMNGKVPPTPAVMALLMDLMEFPNSNKLTQEIKEETSSTEKAKQLEAAMKNLEGQLKMLQTENIKLQKRIELKDLQSEIEIFKAEMKHEGKDVLSQLDQIIKNANSEPKAE